MMLNIQVMSFFSGAGPLNLIVEKETHLNKFFEKQDGKFIFVGF
jgi:hypothetical protein